MSKLDIKQLAQSYFKWKDEEDEFREGLSDTTFESYLAWIQEL